MVASSVLGTFKGQRISLQSNENIGELESGIIVPPWKYKIVCSSCFIRLYFCTLNYDVLKNAQLFRHNLWKSR